MSALFGSVGALAIVYRRRRAARCDSRNMSTLPVT
jgi:hypothetical protein